MKPVIGITVNYSREVTAVGIGFPGQTWHLLTDEYVSAVVQAGGTPLLLPITEDPDAMKAMMDAVDGILFSGGNDVDAAYFGERTLGKCGPIVPERDAQEAFLARYALEETDKPILGICRGMQIINAALGGTLHQHLPDANYMNHALDMYPLHMETHTVTIQPGSLLAGIVETERLPVNSYHHMAVAACAPLLTAVAHSEDGVIEAVELKEKEKNRFFLGVQWHPEFMASNSPVQKNILSAFIASC